jgi:glycosyltransferase involved in cell wall biosynthesis
VNEGTPVSVIEALAAERPAVATHVGGIPDVVRDGVDGFLVDSDEPDALAERLAELAADAPRRAAMGEAGRARVLERYAVERLVADIDALYRELLASRVAP